ncbi:MAG TPA: hypothetical protein VHW66_03390 [Stellaceae bacterium]|jgi:hypothetical protein|nr:hypothetical protein [Stellaceae bacterium]
MYDHDALTRRGHVDCVGNPVTADHPHFLQPVPQIFDVRLAHLFEPMGLDQRDDPIESRPDIGGHRFQLRDDSRIQQGDGPPAQLGGYAEFAMPFK